MRSEIAPIIKSGLEESAQVKLAMAKNMLGEIERMVTFVLAAYRAGGKVVVFGNGGSAADAQHLAGELVGRFKLERPALPAIALSTNTSILTAIANDYGYDVVFSRQIEALVTEKDVVIGISTSGRSPNVIEAIKAAKKKGAKTIVLTGGKGGPSRGRMAEEADLVLAVPSDNFSRVQEAHIAIIHIVCELVEKELFGR
jgi:D-sedoheptulose 7-phosphate isomerase